MAAIFSLRTFVCFTYPSYSLKCISSVLSEMPFSPLRLNVLVLYGSRDVMPQCRACPRSRKPQSGPSVAARFVFLDPVRQGEHGVDVGVRAVVAPDHRALLLLGQPGPPAVAREIVG